MNSQGRWLECGIMGAQHSKTGACSVGTGCRAPAGSRLVRRSGIAHDTCTMQLGNWVRGERQSDGCSQVWRTAVLRDTNLGAQART